MRPAVSSIIRQKALALGEPGRAWLAALPRLVAEIEHRWAIDVGEPLPGGSAGFVARARTADGTPVVVKLAVPDAGFASQVATIAAARGRGYVRLLARDDARHALLLEELGPSLQGTAPERAIAVIGRTLREAWTVPRSAVAPGPDKAAGLIALITRLAPPDPGPAVVTAVALATRRAEAFDPDRCVVVHGDPHPGNALRVRAARAGAASGVVLVDPDGFHAEPAYDLGVVLRDWCDLLLAGDARVLARRWCRQLATAAEVDETAVWEWGLVERVSTGLYLIELGAVDAGRRFLRTAELIR